MIGTELVFGPLSEKRGDNEIRPLGIKLFAPLAPSTNRVRCEDSARMLPGDLRSSERLLKR